MRILNLLKKVNPSQAWGVLGVLLTLGGAVVDNKNAKYAKHAAAKEAAEIVMKKLAEKEN